MGSAPIRIAALPLALVLYSHTSGCSIETDDARAARRAAERYLAALTAHDAAALHAGGTYAGAVQSVRGATILRLGRVHSISRSALDSLAAGSRDDEKRAETDCSRAVEWDADSLFLRLDAMKRRAGLYRSASRAAERSRMGAPGARAAVAETGAAATLRACAVRVRIRWGGPLVGPEAVDREHVLREVAAPGGPWVVFSLEQREDDWNAGFPASAPFPTAAGRD
ncbi:MAG TPA: hypothetical protein VK123_08615 [Candidatus Limnocylindrales bacterium]|nr:hypothetical protein [Candidatus Limnocylindrales bacterium]